MLSDEWLSRCGLLENFNASVTRTRTGTGTWTTGVTAIALCTSCSRAKKRRKKKETIHFFSGEAVLTSTHNLCFGAKIIKIDISMHTPVLLYNSGVQGRIRTCFSDDISGFWLVN